MIVGIRALHYDLYQNRGFQISKNGVKLGTKGCFKYNAVTSQLTKYTFGPTNI